MKLAPYEYIHVLDRNLNHTRIVIGPLNFIQQDHEEIVTGSNPQPYIILKPYTYAVISDPVVRGKKGELLYDENKMVKVHYGEKEIRTADQYPEPFPLYPGESLVKIDKLSPIPRDCALKVRANRDFADKDKVERKAGDEWLIHGPKVYVPTIEVDQIELQEPKIIEVNKALRLKAKMSCVDSMNVKREAGEEWLIRKPGQYMLGVKEAIVEFTSGYVLTDKKSLHLVAIRTFTDIYNQVRKAGEEWLVTKKDAAVHICDVHEKIVGEVPITVLQKNEYAYLLNPRSDGKVNQMGKKILVTGPIAFFLQPGEVLDGGIKKFYVLSDDEALLLKAAEDFQDKESEILRKAGDRWMIRGPRNYVPPVEVEVIERRQAIPLDAVEGIYIRDITTGGVRAQIGKTYMMNEHEELADKDLPPAVEELLRKQGQYVRKHKSTLVTFKCPFNAAVQVYDYKDKKSRVVFGPSLVVLEPNEQFTVTYLSGKTPKRPGQVSTLYLLLGPTFSTDVADVETSDHARLTIKMSFNWMFKINPAKPEQIFNVRDFIGDMCKSMGSRVRSIVANLPFDTFHKSSVKYVRQAIFGYNKETEKINEGTFFDTNGLDIFNVDIQNIEPIDKKTKESLEKTVTQAIRITTSMQEQEAKRNAEKMEMEEIGKMEKMKLDNKSTAEEARKKLLEFQADSDAIRSQGQAIAEAKAHAEAKQIEMQADVDSAQMKSKCTKLKELSEIEHEKAKAKIEIDHKLAMSKLRIQKAEELSKIEGGKFKSIMDAISKDTLIEIAKAGPDTQASMLKGLGLQGYMLMDSKSPINLFTAAQGMIGASMTGPMGKI